MLVSPTCRTRLGVGNQVTMPWRLAQVVIKSPSVVATFSSGCHRRSKTAKSVKNALAISAGNTSATGPLTANPWFGCQPLCRAWSSPQLYSETRHRSRDGHKTALKVAGE